MKCTFQRCCCLAALLVSTLPYTLAQESGAPSASSTTQQAPSKSSARSGAANQEQSVDAQMQALRADVRGERKKLIAENMPLTETEATKFWPVYDRYVAETTKVNDARYELIKDYAKNYDSLSDQQAQTLIKRSLALESDATQVRTRFIPEFEKAISPKKTALFFQIDRRINMLVDLVLASEVPVIQP